MVKQLQTEERRIKNAQNKNEGESNERGTKQRCDSVQNELKMQQKSQIVQIKSKFQIPTE